MKYYEDSCYIIEIDDESKEMKVFARTTDAHGNEGILLPVITLDFLEDTYDFIRHLVKVTRGERN